MNQGARSDDSEAIGGWRNEDVAQKISSVFTIYFFTIPEPQIKSGRPFSQVCHASLFVKSRFLDSFFIFFTTSSNESPYSSARYTEPNYDEFAELGQNRKDTG